MASDKGYNWDTSELIVVDGRFCRIFYDDDGNEFRRVLGSRIGARSNTPRPEITVSRRGDPTAYHREYYRKVRSKAQGRAIRGPYKKSI